MREIIQRQMSFGPARVAHAHAAELERMSGVLDELPRATELVHADLLLRNGKPIHANRGRDGMTAEQVVRALIVKQMRGFSYEELSFHLADSSTYRSFCRIGIERHTPKKSTLQKNIKRVKETTWEAILRMVVEYAAAKGIERGERVRADCTVVESNIHHPTDSRLLWDCVRVLVRLMKSAKRGFGLKFCNHARRAKRRALGISNAKSMKVRVPLYHDLLKMTHGTVSDALRIIDALGTVKTITVMQRTQAHALATDLRHYVNITNRVVDQTQRRVLGGESVPALEKVVSIFEPHTDIIVKDRRDTLYGHKICLTSGASGLVTDVVVEEGNPCDSTLAVKMIKRQREIFRKPPAQVSFDGGFASKSNLAELKAMGVRDVAFAKRCGLAITDMVKSTGLYRALRNFRAGIEGTISYLKRVFGLDRCSWRSLRSFKAYVYGSVLACNLLTIARRQPAAPA